jgi:hypothetical protein
MASPMRVGAPVRLVIPQIRLDAPVEEVWLIPANQAGSATGDGADHLLASSLDGSQIGLPSGPGAVGWYAFGATPGSPGASLLVGHVDTASGPAVFSRLPSLRPGALIQLDLTSASPTTLNAPLPLALSGISAERGAEEPIQSRGSRQQSIPVTDSTTFMVDGGWRHSAEIPPPAELFAVDGPSRLFLVTCTGRFVRNAGGYQERLIIAASPFPADELTA